MGAACGRRALAPPRLEEASDGVASACCQAFRRDFPKEWTAISTADGESIQVRALQSQLRLQGLSEAGAAHPHGALHFYMIYLWPTQRFT